MGSVWFRKTNIYTTFTRSATMYGSAVVCKRCETGEGQEGRGDEGRGTARRTEKKTRDLTTLRSSKPPYPPISDMIVVDIKVRTVSGLLQNSVDPTFPINHVVAGHSSISESVFSMRVFVTQKLLCTIIPCT